MEKVRRQDQHHFCLSHLALAPSAVCVPGLLGAERASQHPSQEGRKYTKETLSELLSPGHPRLSRSGSRGLLLAVPTADIWQPELLRIQQGSLMAGARSSTKTCRQWLDSGLAQPLPMHRLTSEGAFGPAAGGRPLPSSPCCLQLGFTLILWDLLQELLPRHCAVFLVPGKVPGTCCGWLVSVL